MPKKLERKLELQAEKKGLTGERKNRYVYGSLRKTGWKPSTQKVVKAMNKASYKK
jgi:hypothetical protein